VPGAIRPRRSASGAAEQLELADIYADWDIDQLPSTMADVLADHDS
jgi:hypothetical protein